MFLDEEKLEFKKDYVLEKLVEISKNKKKYICVVNYLKKVKNGYYKDIPDSFIGINDFSQNQKNLKKKKVQSLIQNLMMIMIWKIIDLMFLWLNY